MKRLQCALFLCCLLAPLTVHALSLEEGLKIVAETGRDVKIAQTDETIARDAVSLSRSPWLPWVDLYGRETWLKYQPYAKFGPNVAVPISQDKFATYGIRATQMLYDFGKTSSSINAAQYGLQAREIETHHAKNRSSFDFILAYLDLLEAEKLLQVSTDEVKNYEAHKKDTEAKYSAGVITRNEVLQSDVMLADSRQRFLTVENLRSYRASKINSLLMRPLNDAVQAVEVNASPASGITLEDAWTFAAAESTEIRDLNARIGAKEESVKAVRAEYLPTVYLSGGYEYLENEYMVHQDNWTVIAGVNINLFSGGASDSKVRIGKSEAAGLRLVREKVLDGLRLEIKGAYLELQSSMQKIEVTKTAVAQAEENLRLQKIRYKEGVGTTTEVLDAVTLLTAAGSNSWKALYSLKRAEAGLLYAMGRDLASVYGK